MTNSRHLLSSSKLSVTLSLLIVLCGCSGASSGGTTTQSPTALSSIQSPTDVAVTGVLTTEPTELENPTPRNPEQGQFGTFNYGSVLYVTEVQTGPAALANASILIHFEHTPEHRAEDFPSPGTVLEANGTYRPGFNVLVISSDGGATERGLSVVRRNASAPEPPVVGEEGDRVRIRQYVFSDSASDVQRVAHDGTTIRIVDNSTAVVEEGRVELGETFYADFNGLIIEVIGPDSSNQSKT
ncbi:hypothetical protein [Salinigranum marinum]|uniref:hypothetical protein n=1 Tax=Salinigranum marinum TaxID=1515595 RepID=UPI002989AD4A|nr:hypothetical protein [Salinigranum marinum]